MTQLESPIVGLTFQVRELGRLRMGERVPTGRTKNGKPVMRPEKLATFRLTSTDWRLIARAAELYGGEPSTWADAPGWNPDKQTGTRQFQVTTTTDAIPVKVPAELNWSQAMEAWTAAKCVRRCNGNVMDGSGEACRCRDEADEGRVPLCKPYSRVNLILPELPGYGFWRLETHGWAAAREFIPMVVMAARLFGEAETYRLRIDPRSKKGEDEHGRPVTYHFGVPVLDTDRTPMELYELAAAEQVPLAIEPPPVPPPATMPATPSRAASSSPAAAPANADPPAEAGAAPDPPAADGGARAAVATDPASSPPGPGRGRERAAAGDAAAGEAHPSPAAGHPVLCDRCQTTDHTTAWHDKYIDDEEAEQAAYDARLALDDGSAP